MYILCMWCIHRSAFCAQTHRQVHPQSAQNASAALASKFPLPWRRYTSNSPGGWSSRSRGLFLSPKKTKIQPPKSMETCRNPNQKNYGFRCFFFLMGKGLELGEATLTGHEDSITKASGPDRSLIPLGKRIRFMENPLAWIHWSSTRFFHRTHLVSPTNLFE